MVNTIGHIHSLALRPQRSTLPQRVDSARAIDALGLAGDIHADPLSPRQLLLAGSAIYEELGLPAHALRENLLAGIDTSRLRSGTVLHIGDEVLIWLMFQCEACGQLDLQRPGLARALGPHRGTLARVVRGGILRPGDAVRDLGRILPPWSDDWKERVVQVLDAVPPDAVIEYRQLARLAGVASTYCRAFPSMLRKLGPAYAAKAVPAQSAVAMPRWDGSGLFDQPDNIS